MLYLQFFIRFGKINILAKDDQSTVTSLLAGDHIGGFEFLFDLLYEHTLVTGTFTELLVLERSDFNLLLENPRFSDIKEHLASTVQDLRKHFNRSKLRVNDRTHCIHENVDEEASEDNDVFPTWLINQVEAELVKPKKKREDEVNEVMGHNEEDNGEDAREGAAATDDESKKLNYQQGIAWTLLDWWKQRSNINQQMSIFSKNMSKKKKFADMLNENEDNELVHLPDYFVILADSRLRRLWDAFSFVFALYLAIMIPQRIHNVTEKENHVLSDVKGSYLPLDWFCDVFFVLDIYMHSRVFALTEMNEQGKVLHITERDHMINEYYKSGCMTRDILLFLPYDLAGFFLGSWNALRIPKVLIAFRLPQMVGQLKDHLLRAYNIQLSLDNVLVVNLLVSTVIFTHWVSSVWAILQIWEEGKSNDATKQQQIDDDDKPDRYISSVYWSLTTLTTVGFGDLTPKTLEARWYVISVMILGSCFTAAVIANITSMAHKVVISEDNPQHVMTCVEKYMVENELPYEIRERCIRYFSMLKSDINEEKILRELFPPPFIPDIAMHVHYDVMKRSPIFSTNNIPVGLTRSIAMLLREEVVVEQDWVLKDNPHHDKWYYVKSGKIHLLDTVKKSKVLFEISQQEGNLSFGEPSLFYSEPEERSPYNARAITNCILISLDPKAFLALESKYEESFQDMRSFIEQKESGSEKSSSGAEQCPREGMRRATMFGYNSVVRAEAAAQLQEANMGGQFEGSIAVSTNFFRLFINACRGRTVLEPDSKFQRRWNYIILFLVIYNAVMVPFRFAYSAGENNYFSALVFFDYVFDALFLLDSRFRYASFAYLDGETIISRLDLIRENYKKQHLWYDLMSIIPIEVIFIPKKMSFGPFGNVQLFYFLRANRLLRTHHARELLRCFDQFFFSVTSKKNKNELKVLKLITFITVFSYWVGCVWFMIASIEHFYEKPNWADCSCPRWPGCSSSSSISSNQLFGCNKDEPWDKNWKPMADLQVRSFYWAATALTTAGYGDVSATTTVEQIFSILIFIIGTMIFATVIANLEEIVAQVDVTSTLFQQKVDEVNALMKIRGIPVVIQEEIAKYQDMIWLKQKGASESAILSYLPARVRHEVMKFHCFKTLKNAVVFKGLSLNFLNHVLDILESDFFLHESIVWEKGECGFELYFITRGNIDLMERKNKLFSVGVGGMLGEGEFFKKEPRSTTAIASEYTTVFFLYHEKLEVLLSEHPHQKALFDEGIVRDEADYDVNAKVEKMRKNLKAGGKMATMLMLDDTASEAKPFVLLPSSIPRRLWDIIIMFAMVANFYCVPFRIAFCNEYTTGMAEDSWFVFNLFIDIIFLADIFLNLRVFAVIFEGVLISKRTEFSELYIRRRLAWDVLACLPVDAAAPAFGVSSLATRSLLRLPRLIHSFRFPYNIQSFIDLCEEQGVRAKAGIWHCARMFVMILIATHWCACVIYYIAVLQGLKDEQSWTATRALNDSKIPILDKYTTSAYWSMYTITLVGYGDITLRSNAEMLFSVFTMLVGSILCDAGITAILSSIVHANDASAGEAQAWVQVITKYMKHRSLPIDLQERIFSFFVHMHLSEDDLDEFKVLMRQPRYIKYILIEEICFVNMREQFAPLMAFSDGFLKSVVHGMYPHLALPKEILLSRAKPADKVFIIVRGKVNALTASMNKFLVTETLEHNAIVGDFKNPEFTYRTVSYCELYTLTLEHYSDCFLYASNNTESALLDRKNKKPKSFLASSSRRLGHRVLSKIPMITSFPSSLSRPKRVFQTNITPADTVRKVWDFTCLIFSLYLMFAVPLEVFVLPEYKFFAQSDNGNDTVMALNLFDAIVDVFFVIDIALRCTIFDDFGAGNKNAEGERETIFWLYMEHSLFWVDLLSSFPMEHMASIKGNNGVAVYRILKLLRVLRISDYTQGVMDVLEERRILNHIGLQRMWSLFFLCTLGGHWASSVFIYVSMKDSEQRADELAQLYSNRTSYPASFLDNATTTGPSWLEQDSLNGAPLISYSFPQSDTNSPRGEVKLEAGLSEIFARGLYWAYVTMITTGFGDITPSTTAETVICIVTMYVGVIITCSAIANLTLLVGHFDEASNAFKQKLDNVNKYLTYQQVPAGLSEKIRQYYAYQWTVLKGVDESAFLRDLSPQLQKRFQEELIKDYLNNVDILRRAPKSLITMMLQVNVMDSISLSPGDFLSKKGEATKGLDLLVHGVAEVLSESGHVESTMRKGESTFGLFLLEDHPEVSTRRAKSYCEFLHMRREKFQR